MTDAEYILAQAAYRRHLGRALNDVDARLLCGALEVARNRTALLSLLREHPDSVLRLDGVRVRWEMAQSVKESPASAREGLETPPTTTIGLETALSGGNRHPGKGAR